MSKKSPFSRLLLWVLGGVTLLLFFRVVSGPPGRSGLLVIEDVDSESLHHRSLDVDRDVSISITGVGSYEDDRAVPPLAAYGWILDRNTREVVWSMDDAEDMIRGRGLTAEVKDEIALEAGQYEVFFASYGNRVEGAARRTLFGRITGGLDWRNDEDYWYLVLDVLEGKETDAKPVHRDREEAGKSPGEMAIWSARTARNHTAEQFLFEVKTDTRVLVRCIGEITNDANDWGWIENVLTRERVWEFDRENSKPAGGLEQNRVSVSEIDLPTGIYLAAYTTDATHAFNDWRGNPPFDPFNWGMSIVPSGSADALAKFDPWENQEPIVALMPSRNSEFKAITFTVDRPDRVMLYGLGEIKRSDRYDYGWIERAPVTQQQDAEYWEDRTPNPDATVWQMEYNDSEPAGGDDSNRRSIAFLELNPDTYTLYYRTDDSHAYEDWRNGEPMQSDRWGVALFSLDKQSDAFQVVRQLELNHAEKDDIEREVEAVIEVPIVTVPLPVNEELILAELNRQGNNVNGKISFEIDEDIPLRVIAAGEISLSGNRYDYGSIERSSNGEVVWELTRENSVPGGGDDANRFFDEVVSFSAGEYIVRFKSDATNAFGQFDSDPPEMPAAWGVTIARVE